MLNYTDGTSQNGKIEMDRDIRNLVKASFRQFVGPGREWGYEELSRATKIPVRSLRAYAGGEMIPDFGNFWILGQVLGEEFLNVLYSHIGYTVTSQTITHDAIAPIDLVQDLTHAITLVVSSYNQNGRFDHTKRKEIDNYIPLLIGKLMGFSKAGAAH